MVSRRLVVATVNIMAAVAMMVLWDRRGNADGNFGTTSQCSIFKAQGEHDLAWLVQCTG